MKLTITADAYALTSSLKVKEIELCKKYNPDALKIKDADGNDKFGISYNEGKPNVSANGVTFGGTSRDENGYATITGTIPSTAKTAEAAKEYVAETFGAVVANLKALEESVPKAAEKIATDRKALVDGIVVA